MALLEVRDLSTTFPSPAGTVRVVDGVSFDVDSGRTLGLVGESGSGKTLTALSIMRLVPPPGRIAAGRVTLAGRDLFSLTEREMRAVRGAEVAMVFQEPTTALNPVLRVGEQIAEAIRLHRRAGGGGVRALAVDMLRAVEVAEPERRFDAYPHQMSGGMRQRVMLAMALACRPRVLIADEPTTALDVTIQAQILDLLGNLQRQLGMAMLLVTHELGIVAERADAVAVIYAGRVVERGPTAAVFRSPLHPYTRGLLQSVPRIGAAGRRLATIPGSVPDPLHLPSGCRFRDRCALAVPGCAAVDPPLTQYAPGHWAACLRAGEHSMRGEA